MSNPLVRGLCMAAATLCMTAVAVAQPAPAADGTAGADAKSPPSEAKAVAPHLARVVSVHTEPATAMSLRVKLMPRYPYAIQTFRVTDKAQLEGLEEGSWVRFTSKRLDGVNTLDSIEPVLECKRMAVCGTARTSAITAALAG